MSELSTMTHLYWVTLHGMAYTFFELFKLLHQDKAVIPEGMLDHMVVLFLVFYLFKKISDTKGTFHAKMVTVKDRNGMDLTEAEDIKNSWQKYTE